MPPGTPPVRPGPAPAWQWDVIVVAGGRARRLGGIDKTALVWNGHSLLDGVLAAAAGARRVCVVGSEAALPATVLRTSERPRWGGPAAAIVAGLDALAADSETDADADWVVVLAADLVRAGEAVAVLLAELDRLPASPGTAPLPGSLPSFDGLISVDAGGRRQPLLAVYRRSALASSAAAHPTVENLSVTSLIGDLSLIEVRLPDALNEDVDTPVDAARLGIVLPAPAPAPGAAPPTP
jgi:molybdopterin-guanine dinucleotide biosynthesis protein A